VRHVIGQDAAPSTSKQVGVRRWIPVALVVVVATLTAGVGGSGALAARATAGTVGLDRAAAPATTTTTTTTGVPVPPTATPATTTPPPTTEAPAPTTTPAPAPPAVAAAPGGHFTMDPYRGLGAWLDVYDWSETFARGGPPAEGPHSVDAMADLGARTLFIQGSKWDSPTDVLEPLRLGAIIERAQARGIAVVVWYLPTLVDPEADLRRLLALASLPVDGLAVDIEALNVDDVTERSRRLVELSARLRAALPGQVLGGIVLEPVLLEEVNTRMWPGFPWAEIAPHYDVWLPMAYWTNRRADSGWRDGHRYTAENIDRVRARIGRPDAPVHALGGIADRTTPEQLAGFRQAALERGALGASIYDHNTTAPHLWPELQALRGLGS
jgi:hypothetical protein